MRRAWITAVAFGLVLFIVPLPSSAAVASGSVRAGTYGTTCPLTPNCAAFWASNCQDVTGTLKQRTDAVSTSIVDVATAWKNTTRTFAVTGGAAVGGGLTPQGWIEFYGLDPLNPASGNPFTCQARTFKAGTVFVKFKNLRPGQSIAVVVPSNANWLMVTGQYVTGLTWTLT